MNSMGEDAMKINRLYAFVIIASLGLATSGCDNVKKNVP